MLRKIVLVSVVLLAAITCFLLGWWQWGRYSSANGTLQNLGYAAQWPVFGCFFIYFYYRFNKLTKKQQNQSPPSKKDINKTRIPTEFLHNQAFQPKLKNK